MEMRKRHAFTAVGISVCTDRNLTVGQLAERIQAWPLLLLLFISVQNCLKTEALLVEHICIKNKSCNSIFSSVNNNFLKRYCKKSFP